MPKFGGERGREQRQKHCVERGERDDSAGSRYFKSEAQEFKFFSAFRRKVPALIRRTAIIPSVRNTDSCNLIKLARVDLSQAINPGKNNPTNNPSRGTNSSISPRWLLNLHFPLYSLERNFIPRRKKGRRKAFAKKV